jgi:glycosyltransferase involved in cell wall biosynthesis
MNEPLVSIGLPVYNGDNYLADALDSILAQTFTDFEVVIADNASTDDTEVICRRYAASDTRIRYHRQPQNLGAAPNYNSAYHRSRGRYFKWSAHDDLLEPTFLQKCVDVLDNQPETVVAYTMLSTIDEEGRRTGDEVSQPGLAADDVAERVRSAIYPYKRGGVGNAPIFGLMRRSALDRTRLNGSYTGSDRTLLLELAIQGPFELIPERLFLERDHPDRSIRIRRKVTDRGHVREAWFDTKRTGKIVFPNWRRLREFLSGIIRAPLPINSRIQLILIVSRWVFAGNWKRLLNDLRLAVVMLFNRARRPKTETT